MHHKIQRAVEVTVTAAWSAVVVTAAAEAAGRRWCALNPSMTTYDSSDDS